MRKPNANGPNSASRPVAAGRSEGVSRQRDHRGLGNAIYVPGHRQGVRLRIYNVAPGTYATRFPRADSGQFAGARIPHPNQWKVTDTFTLQPPDGKNPAHSQFHDVESAGGQRAAAWFSGDEFTCVEYPISGYDGLLLGGTILNAHLAGRIIAAVHAGDFGAAEQLQIGMCDLMYRVYGGPKIECWLTGLKELPMQMKVFSPPASLLGYPLTESCLTQIRAAVTGSDGLGFNLDLLGEPPHRSSPDKFRR